MWFTAITTAMQILLLILKASEKNQIISEAIAVERAKIVNEINQSLVLAAQIPAELARLSDEELDSYVEKKGWYRD